MTRPKRYADLTPEQREAFDAKYGKPTLASVAAVAVSTVNGVTLGLDSPLRPVNRRRHRGVEHDEQAALFRRIDAHPVWAELPIYAVPNGGYRTKATAAKLKAEGVRAGVPDISIDVARGDWHGMRIEMKVKPNKPTDAQVAFMKRLMRQGILTVVCYSADEAWAELSSYLALPPYGESD